MKRLSALVITGCATIFLAGCLPQHAQWAGNETMKRNTVELVRVAHDVRFTDGSDALGDAEAARLEAFLKARGPGSADRIFIDLPDEEDDAAPVEHIRDNARARTLAGHLADLGHDVHTRPLPHGAVPAPDTVRVVIERHVVTSPGCPDWRQPASPNYENAPSSNWGCANVTALGLMVADPRDLVEGREYRSLDAQSAADAVRRLREDEVKWEEGENQLSEDAF
ncbi:MAG: CpaD family pilus assembly lipoprotein [Sphingomonadales bacterium]